MRLAMIVATAATLLAGSTATATAGPATTGDAPYVIAAVTAPAASLAAVQEPAKGEVDVKVDVGDEGGTWYANPFWIVLGVVALVVVVLLVAMAGRGGGDTTVVR